MPAGFSGTMTLFSPEVWLPLSVYDQVANNFAGEGKESLADRAGRQLLVIGRLKENVSAKAADPALKTLAANLEATYPAEQKDQTLVATPLSRFSTSNAPQDDGGVMAIGPLLLGTALVVLLVACLNLANMLLARGTARKKEIAIRLALGGSRARIVRQLLTEGLLLALLGGLVGVLLASWSSSLFLASLKRLVPLDLVWSTGPSAAVLLATFGFCLFATICFALGPAFKLSRASVVEDLKEHAGEDFVRRRWRFLPRHPLVVMQIAFSLALVTAAAALFLRAAQKAASVETGLKADRDFVLEVDATLGGSSEEQARDIYRRVASRLAQLPGVESSSISATIPFGMMSMSRSIQRAGLHPAADQKPSTAAEGLAFDSTWNSIGADYFNAVGLPVIRGRDFTAAEATQPGGPAVAIIDTVLAKKLWPDGDALGQRIQYARPASALADDSKRGVGMQENGGGDIKPEEPIEIVGIVPATSTGLFDKEPSGAIYLPFARGFQSDIYFYVKVASLGTGSVAAQADLLRRTVREVDATMPILSLETFPQHLDTNMQLWLVRAAATMFSVFGGVALALAVVGIYGVKAYSVARRTREIGIRMALGARPSNVQWMILREGAFMLAAGVGLGLLLALGIGKAVSGLLYKVGSFDAIALTTAPLFIAMATLLATWLPARRATRVSPMTALRTE